MKLTETNMLLLGGGIAALGLLILTTKPGAAAAAGEAVGGAVVDAVGGATTGVVTKISEAVGLPTPAETITDAAECKLYMDEYGYLKASAKCSAPAFFEALTTFN